MEQLVHNGERKTECLYVLVCLIYSNKIINDRLILVISMKGTLKYNEKNLLCL